MFRNATPGNEEGRLIYLGVLQALNLFNKRTFVLDIGGGSAEYVLGEKGVVKYVNSLKIGAIRITKKFELSRNPTAQNILGCRRYIRGELSLTAKYIREKGFKAAVGSSGTIQAVAAIIAAQRIRPLPIGNDSLNNFSFTYSEVQRVIEQLVAAPLPEIRALIPGLDAKRSDIILGGALVLGESMRMLAIDQLTVSRFALREGVIFNEIERRHEEHDEAHGKIPHELRHDVRERSVRNLAERTAYDKQHAEQVARLALRLFDATKKLHGLGVENRSNLYFAAILHDIGYSISHSSHHLHSYYIISNAELMGFTKEEIEVIANVARYHRKSHPKLKHEGFARLATEEHREVVRRLAAILRIADGLDRGHTSAVQDIACTFRVGNIKITVTPSSEADRNLELELWGAERKLQLFEEVFLRRVSLEQTQPNPVPVEAKKSASKKRIASSPKSAKRSTRKVV